MAKKTIQKRVSKTINKASKMTKKSGNAAQRMAIKTKNTAKKVAAKAKVEAQRQASQLSKTVKKEVPKVTQAAKHEASKMGKTAKQQASKVTKAVKDGTYKCQICGKEAKNPVDAATHLLDHGASALDSVSTMIKDQKEGNVSKEDREAAHKVPKGKKSVDEEEAK